MIDFLFTSSIAQCYFEAYVRKYITGPLALKSTGFMPPKSLWPTIPPEYYDNLRGVIQVLFLRLPLLQISWLIVD